MKRTKKLKSIFNCLFFLHFFFVFLSFPFSVKSKFFPMVLFISLVVVLFATMPSASSDFFFSFKCRLIGRTLGGDGVYKCICISSGLPATKVTSLSIIQRSAKYKCTCTYFPMRWCNLMVTSRAFSITVSGMYEKCTGSPLKCCPPMLKNTFACVNTCIWKRNEIEWWKER